MTLEQDIVQAERAVQGDAHELTLRKLAVLSARWWFNAGYPDAAEDFVSLVEFEEAGETFEERMNAARERRRRNGRRG
jgi:hypothetical protein